MIRRAWLLVFVSCVSACGLSALTKAVRKGDSAQAYAIYQADSTNKRPGDLADVIQNGDVETIRGFLSKGISPDSDVLLQGSVGTPLMLAAKIGKVDIAKFLLDSGANVNRQVDPIAQFPQNYYSALIFAAQNGNPE